MKRYLIPIILISISIIIFIIGILFGKQIANKKENNKNINTIISENNENKYSIDFKTVNKITISYLSENIELSNEEKNLFLSELSETQYKEKNDPGLIVSTDFKIIFNNGTYFTFGNYGNEVDVYKNDVKQFTTELPDNILNKIRDRFNFGNSNNRSELNTNQLNVN